MAVGCMIDHEISGFAAADALTAATAKNAKIIFFITANYNISIAHNIHQNIVWDLMKEIELKIAKKRGLL